MSVNERFYWYMVVSLIQSNGIKTPQNIPHPQGWSLLKKSFSAPGIQSDDVETF